MHSQRKLRPVPDAAEISRAIIKWTGFSSAPKPDRDSARLVEGFGELDAVELCAIVQSFEAEFHESDAYNTVAGLAEMSLNAANDFRIRHPRDLRPGCGGTRLVLHVDWK